MINLVVALMVEARPLVEYFRLREDRGARGFRVYSGDAMRLIVTGVGKVNAAAGVAYLHRFGSGAENEAWLNVGIAGHPDRPLGQGVHAIRIVDAATERAWYPPQTIPLPGHPAVVLTVDQPVVEFADKVACDMEASGFYSCAVRFATSELIQCYKVISDNREIKSGAVTKASVRTLIHDNASAVQQIADHLRTLRQALPANDQNREEFERFLQRWHFTVSQKHQLEDLLRRWYARTEEPVWNEDLNRSPSAKAAMARVLQRFDELVVL
ncbi:MAG: hypothetical protein OES09_13025 [Gammaproteobacteria bacterium]|nr:hypothetical protein [Gammaproteobacteria bacterium]